MFGRTELLQRLEWAFLLTWSLCAMFAALGALSMNSGEVLWMPWGIGMMASGVVAFVSTLFRAVDLIVPALWIMATLALTFGVASPMLLETPWPEGVFAASLALPIAAYALRLRRPTIEARVERAVEAGREHPSG